MILLSRKNLLALWRFWCALGGEDGSAKLVLRRVYCARACVFPFGFVSRIRPFVLNSLHRFRDLKDADDSFSGAQSQSFDSQNRSL